MSLDAEEQEDELLALASIFEDDFTSAQDQECDQGVSDGQNFLKGGELVIHLDLPPGFSLLTRHTLENGEVEEGKQEVENLPPIYLHFTYPTVYPSAAPPTFTLSCKWLNRGQLTQLCQQLDNLWAENEGCVIVFNWAQFLKDQTLMLLRVTDTLDLDTIKPTRQSLVAATSCNGPATGSDRQSDINGASSVVDASSGGLSRQNSQNYDSRAIQDLAPKTNICRLLKDYDEEMRQKLFKLKDFECKVCFDNKLGVHCLEFWPCRHVYCKDCMAAYFETQIKEGNIKCLRCPEDKCESEANPKQVQELVPEELYERWDEMLLNSTLSSLGDIQPCPRTHCQYPVTVEEQQGQCPSCKFVFCGICRFGWHGIEPCRVRNSEVKEVIDVYINADSATKALMENRYGKKYLNTLKDEFLSMSYLEENSKQCPKCCAKIEKIDGCNKMTCYRCNRYFCWLCLQILSKGNPYDHYYDLTLPCFERTFDDDDD